MSTEISMSTTEIAAETLLARPKRADARRNYDKVLAAAREAFAEGGESTALEEIARRAGVGIGTLYRHFPNRQALLEALYVNEVEAICRSAAELDNGDPWEALTGWFERSDRIFRHQAGAGPRAARLPRSGCGAVPDLPRVAVRGRRAAAEACPGVRGGALGRRVRRRHADGRRHRQDPRRRPQPGRAHPPDRPRRPPVSPRGLEPPPADRQDVPSPRGHARTRPPSPMTRDPERRGVDVPDGRGRTGLDRVGRDLDRNPNVVIGDVEVTSDGWHVLRRTTYDYRRADGSWETQQRETYDRGNGATILLYDPDRRDRAAHAPVQVPRLRQRPSRRDADRGRRRAARRRRP